jgi:hypothetical protein
MNNIARLDQVYGLKRKRSVAQDKTQSLAGISEVLLYPPDVPNSSLRQDSYFIMAYHIVSKKVMV